MAARCVCAKYASISLHISNCESDRERESGGWRGPGGSPPMWQWLTQRQSLQVFDSAVVPLHLCVLVSWGGTQTPPSQLADERRGSTSCHLPWTYASSKCQLWVVSWVRAARAPLHVTEVRGFSKTAPLFFLPMIPLKQSTRTGIISQSLRLPKPCASLPAITVLQLHVSDFNPPTQLWTLK